MKTVYKVLVLALVVITSLVCIVNADNENENDISAKNTVEAEIEINEDIETAESEDKTDESQASEAESDENAINEGDVINGISEKLDSILVPGDDTLEEEMTDTLEKYSDNWLVKLFKPLIDAITSFLNKLLALASEAAKIGV